MIEQIHEYILNELAPSGTNDVTNEESLLLAGVIDSVGMIDLINFLETTFSISIDEDDMTPENFDSIVAIVNYVGEKQAAVSH